MKNICSKATILILAIGLTACQSNQTQKKYTQAEIDSLRKAFQIYVEKKNQKFKNADWSPLKDKDKEQFGGLWYYPYQIEWRFKGPIHTYNPPDSITITGTGENDVRSALKYGYFQFNKDGQEHKLQIIKILSKNPSEEGHLFLGFWDETSGQSTYGGGRYINLEKAADGQYIVDFNYAYNPYCAYSDRYSCAIPPKENELSLAITAGEKAFNKH